MAKQNQTQQSDQDQADEKQVFSIRLVRSAAFGNGTRSQGFTMGTIEVHDGQMRLDSAKPADGVTASEMSTALLNPQLLELA